MYVYLLRLAVTCFFQSIILSWNNINSVKHTSVATANWQQNCFTFNLFYIMNSQWRCFSRQFPCGFSPFLSVLKRWLNRSRRLFLFAVELLKISGSKRKKTSQSIYCNFMQEQKKTTLSKFIEQKKISLFLSALVTLNNIFFYSQHVVHLKYNKKRN